MVPSCGNLFPSFSHQVTPGLGNAEGGAFFPKVLGVRQPTLPQPQSVLSLSPGGVGYVGAVMWKAETPKGQSPGPSAVENEALGWPNTMKAATPAALQMATTSKWQEAWGQPPAGR